MNTFSFFQSRHDNSLPRDNSIDEAKREQTTNKILDEMLVQPDSYDAWLSSVSPPDSVTKLLASLFESRCMQLDKTLTDEQASMVDAVVREFSEWAQKPLRNTGKSPVEEWVQCPF